MNEALQLHLESRQMRALVVASEGRGKQISKALERQQIASERYTSLPRIREKIKKSPVDLVLADLDMPELSVAAAIRTLKEVKHDVPLLLVSSEAPGVMLQFLEPDVFFCSFGDLSEGNLKLSGRGSSSRAIDMSKLGASKAPQREAGLARHVVADLHHRKTGRLDAKRIAAYLGISLSSLAAATGRKVAAIHKAPAADSLQQALAPVAQTIALLSKILESKQHVRAWLHSPHPDLGGRIPMQLILEGHAGGVADMLGAALAGQPS